MFITAATGLTYISTQQVLGPISWGIKWPGSEARHSHPFSAEGQKCYSYTSSPPPMSS
jgi:hypothetical protein